jgi:hypothetical protein
MSKNGNNEVYVEILNGLYINWGEKDTGFGQLRIYVGQDGKMHCDNELMSRGWVKKILGELVDRCVFDCPHSTETKKPIIGDGTNG